MGLEVDTAIFATSLVVIPLFGGKQQLEKLLSKFMIVRELDSHYFFTTIAQWVKCN